MIEGFIRGLRQPEYVHVLLNPLPVYGLLIAWIGLLIAFFSKSRRAQITALVLVLVSSLSAWPVYEFGQQGYDRVLSMTDEDGERWLDEHEDRAEDLIWIFYALAVLSAVAIAAPMKWPKSSAPLVIAVVFLAAVTLGTGYYIAYAGGKIRHREFRNEPAPPKRSAEEHLSNRRSSVAAFAAANARALATRAPASVESCTSRSIAKSAASNNIPPRSRNRSAFSI
jgi:glucan phosphoethanolaminetransferase (alkaline phosphatase superfamily)